MIDSLFRIDLKDLSYIGGVEGCCRKKEEKEFRKKLKEFFQRDESVNVRTYSGSGFYFPLKNFDENWFDESSMNMTREQWENLTIDEFYVSQLTLREDFEKILTEEKKAILAKRRFLKNIPEKFHQKYFEMDKKKFLHYARCEIDQDYFEECRQIKKEEKNNRMKESEDAYVKKVMEKHRVSCVDKVLYEDYYVVPINSEKLDAISEYFYCCYQVFDQPIFENMQQVTEHRVKWINMSMMERIKNLILTRIKSGNRNLEIYQAEMPHFIPIALTIYTISSISGLLIARSILF
jgi:hypothetical protein